MFTALYCKKNQIVSICASFCLHMKVSTQEIKVVLKLKNDFEPAPRSKFSQESKRGIRQVIPQAKP